MLSLTPVNNWTNVVKCGNSTLQKTKMKEAKKVKRESDKN